jgi:large subunit ribosomal protein L29
MDAKELRQKNAAELREELLNLRREQFNLRMSQATGQAAKPDQFTKVRRNIARLKTVIAEQGQPGKETGKVVDKVTAKAKGASK